MKYLKQAAAVDYYNLSCWSFESRIISYSQYSHRLGALIQMLETNCELVNQIRKILVSEEVANDEWVDQVSLNEDIYDKADKGQDIVNRVNSIGEEDDLLIYHFHPSSNTGLNNWYFYIGDPDNFPSVPHGHFNKSSKHKLDAYLGWEYINSKQVRRVKRSKIILLWNDDKFRSFAKSAIIQFMTANPHFSWKHRVPFSPHRLPRKRKR